ncbi:hypothetical protein FB561_0887 [Kribbella amoyensis]|uniref:Uncharacterized protein n=1 Tax=Kribbella amoyensis TaxID=996641 RepID=A0A561BLR5_9ACTN|nr:hypothetical protein [Kribbella amoyensis]TWD79821.1 hypothetical protein FB561_0887 [Kribbella amoyensis]
MSSLLRPIGHLPASVYWFRRALLLVVLVVLVVLMARLFGGSGDDQQNAAAGGPEQIPPSSQPPVPSTTPSTGSTPSPDRPGDGRTTASGKPSTPVKPSSTPPATPKDVQCTGRDVRIDVLPAVRTVTAGGSLNFAVQLSAVRDECKAVIDPTLLSVTITSGQDQIWTTTQCEQAIPRATLVVAKGKDSTSTVLWNGRRSGPGCLPGQPQAKAGTYVAKAVYDGQVSSLQAFYVV